MFYLRAAGVCKLEEGVITSVAFLTRNRGLTGAFSVSSALRDDRTLSAAVTELAAIAAGKTKIILPTRPTA